MLLEALRDLREDITDAEGYAHRCEPKGHYRVRGERVVSFSDQRVPGYGDYPELLRQAVTADRTPDLQSQRCSCTDGEQQTMLMCSRTLIQFDLTVLRIGITKFITVDGFRIQHKIQLFWVL